MKRNGTRHGGNLPKPKKVAEKKEEEKKAPYVTKPLNREIKKFSMEWFAPYTADLDGSCKDNARSFMKELFDVTDVAAEFVKVRTGQSKMSAMSRRQLLALVHNRFPENPRNEQELADAKEFLELVNAAAKEMGLVQ